MKWLQNTFFNLILTIALWAGGVHLTLQAIQNRAPTTITAKELIEESPSADWVNITGARLNLEDPCYLTPRGGKEPAEVLIPIRFRRGEGDILIKALLLTKNPEYLKPSRPLEDVVDIDVSGMVERGNSQDSGAVSAAKEHYGPKVFGGFVFVRDGGRPRFLYGLALLVVAAAATYFFYLRRFLNAGRQSPAAPPEQSPNKDGNEPAIVNSTSGGRPTDNF